MSAITRACGLLARAWESENDPRNTELGVIPDIAREMSVAAQREEDQLRADLAKAEKEAKRCADGWDALQAKLAAATRGGADIVAQRDTALGLCKQRERELAKVTAERDQARTGWKTTSALAVETQNDLDAERAAHAETRKALELADTINGRTLKELSAANKAHADTHADAQRYFKALESTRAELATALERVKELLRQKEASWKGYGSNG